MRGKRLIRNTAIHLGYMSLMLGTFIFILIFIMHTTFFRDKLRDMLIQQTRKKTGLTLSIAHMEGNIFTGMVVEKIILQGPGAEKISLDKLELRLSPLKLLQGRIIFPLLSFSNPKVIVRRTKEGVFRIPPFPPAPPSSQRGEKERRFPLCLSLEKFHINHGSILFQDHFQKESPQEISLQDLNLDLSFGLSFVRGKVSWKGAIRKCSLSISPYQLAIRTIQGRISQKENTSK